METQQVLEIAKIIEAIKPNQWLPVIGSVLGALAGGSLVFLSTYWRETQKGREQRLFITLALFAEIRALVIIIETRKYLVRMEEIIDHLKENPHPPYYRMEVRIPDHYSRIYQTHAANIGTVNPDSAAKIIEFHQLIDAVVQDVSVGGPFSEEAGTVEAYSQAAEMLGTALAIGHQLTDL